MTRRHWGVYILHIALFDQYLSSFCTKFFHLALGYRFTTFKLPYLSGYARVRRRRYNDTLGDNSLVEIADHRGAC